jgi:hypothetical protein
MDIFWIPKNNIRKYHGIEISTKTRYIPWYPIFSIVYYGLLSSTSS